jgi:hypothetical protein
MGDHGGLLGIRVAKSRVKEERGENTGGVAMGLMPPGRFFRRPNCPPAERRHPIRRRSPCRSQRPGQINRLKLIKRSING